MTMLLPDASLLSRSVLPRTSRIRGVGQSFTDVPASGTDAGGSDASGTGFWSWLGDTISPVIQSTAPGIINQAAGVTTQTVRTPTGTTTVTSTGTAAAKPSSDTWKWVGIVGLGGVLIFLVAKRKSQGRR